VEFAAWRQYIGQRGTLNVGLRLEIHVAQLITTILASLGRKKDTGAAYTLLDFAPHLRDDKDEVEEIDDALMSFFTKGGRN